MSDRLAAVCGVLGGGLDDPVTLACLVLAGLLVGAIGVGFVALRTALGARPAGFPIGDGGLLELWRLGRQLEHAGAPGGRVRRRQATTEDRTTEHRSRAAA